MIEMEEGQQGGSTRGTRQAMDEDLSRRVVDLCLLEIAPTHLDPTQALLLEIGTVGFRTSTTGIDSTVVLRRRGARRLTLSLRGRLVTDCRLELVGGERRQVPDRADWENRYHRRSMIVGRRHRLRERTGTIVPPLETGHHRLPLRRRSEMIGDPRLPGMIVAQRLLGTIVRRPLRGITRDRHLRGTIAGRRSRTGTDHQHSDRLEMLRSETGPPRRHHLEMDRRHSEIATDRLPPSATTATDRLPPSATTATDHLRLSATAEMVFRFHSETTPLSRSETVHLPRLRREKQASRLTMIDDRLRHPIVEILSRRNHPRRDCRWDRCLFRDQIVDRTRAI
jgi:hypothetical protein